MLTTVAGEAPRVEVVGGRGVRLLDDRARLVDDNAALCAELAGVAAERDLFAAQVRSHARRITELESEVAGLQRQVAGLQDRLEATRREGKRQAAPFSKGNPKAPGQRRRPGRKPGEAYGTKAHRGVPDHVDEVKTADPPPVCDREGCGGRVTPTGETVSQWTTDIPKVAPWVTHYKLGCGRCQSCGKTVRGRHADQPSDAVGAAASQVGPNAVALAALLHHGYGLSHAKCCQVLADLAGVRLTPGGLVGALHRLAGRLAPTDAALVKAVRDAPMVSPDETGWRVAAARRWLWAFATLSAVVFRICHGRGYTHAVDILGPGYAGVLVRDGWAPYRKFELAVHQTCLAHLARRCRELIADSTAGQARVPHLVAAILDDAFALRAQRDHGRLEPGELAAGVAGLRERVTAVTAWAPTHAPNRRLLAHLATEADALFTFLALPGVDATNWRAEQAIRPAVVNRKTWGGNATDRGAATTQTIASVLATARLQARDPTSVLVPVLRARGPTLADLDYTPSAAAPRRHPVTPPATVPASPGLRLISDRFWA